MTARYDGRCARCRKPIKATQRIVWFEGEPHRTRHATCPKVVTEPERIDFLPLVPFFWTEGSPA